MITYILISICLVVSIFNLIILINMSASLLKFYDFYKTSQSQIQTKKTSPPNRNQDGGLIDLNQVGTYDARFQIPQK